MTGMKFPRDNADWLRRLASDGTAFLPSGLQAILHRRFDFDFAQTRIIVDDSLPRIGQYGAAFHNEIRLSPVALSLGQCLCTSIVKHEVVHLVQKRMYRRRGQSSDLSVEAEACREAEKLGGPIDIQEGDRPDTVRYWEHFGHFTIPLFILQAAGYDKKTALRRAFFSQMPDQVEELDAKTIVLRADLLGNKREVEPVPRYYTHHDLLQTKWKDHLFGNFRADQRAYHAKAGLHCFTNTGEADNKMIRARILVENMNSDFLFGLSLHPFGDAFSHVINGKTFSSTAGHAGATVNAAIGRVLGFDRPDVDSITGHAHAAIEYAKLLYRICTSCGPSGLLTEVEVDHILRETIARGPLDADEETLDSNLEISLSRFSQGSTKARTISVSLKEDGCVFRKTRRRKAYDRSFDDPVPWADFYFRNIDYLGPVLIEQCPYSSRVQRREDYLLERILSIAETWAHGVLQSARRREMVLDRG